MKQIFLLLFTCLCFSCHRKIVYQPIPFPDIATKIDLDSVKLVLPNPILLEIEQVGIEEIIHYGKTSCYGLCPVFFIKIFSDGSVQYNGIKNVNRIGIINTTISKDKLGQLVQQIETKGYFKLAKNYPLNGRRIVDFPNTILQINNKEINHTVVNNHDAPNLFFEIEKLILHEMKTLGLAIN